MSGFHYMLEGAVGNRVLTVRCKDCDATGTSYEWADQHKVEGCKDRVG